VSAQIELFLRIVTAALCGAAIGWDRDRRNPAGLRTHSLVAMASAVFMVVSTEFVGYLSTPNIETVHGDPRIAAGAVSGIGFLAGGAILKSSATVRGLTTAAGLWLVAAIGLCTGAGMYGIGIFVTALGLFTLTVVRRVEHKDQRERRKVSVSIRGEATPRPLVDAIGEFGGQIAATDCESRRDHGPAATARIRFDVLFMRSVDPLALVAALSEQAGVEEVRVEAPS
jgi:putative Mg2+ transporter-C (MgtC) family protein